MVPTVLCIYQLGWVSLVLDITHSDIHLAAVMDHGGPTASTLQLHHIMFVSCSDFEP